MAAQLFNNTPLCKVCVHAGHAEHAHTHSTRGPSDPTIEHVIKCGGWNLIKPLGGTTNCPVLQANVCTNPECFNGKDGLVRFPTYGHTTKYCPCAWPEENKAPQQLPYVEQWNYDHPSNMWFLWYWNYPTGQWVCLGSFNDLLSHQLITDQELCDEDISGMIFDEMVEEADEFTDLMDDFVERQDLEEQAFLHQNIHYIED
jgi:hypothetical protein